MKIPWLVHRCHLTNEDILDYQDMDSEEYECGGQAESLRRILIAGFRKETVFININEQQIVVYMVASKEFSFDAYQQYLQLMAEGKLLVKKSIGFDGVVKEMISLKILSQCYNGTGVWFDFENDVFWTLTEDTANRLVVLFEKTKKEWLKM